MPKQPGISYPPIVCLPRPAAAYHSKLSGEVAAAFRSPLRPRRRWLETWIGRATIVQPPRAAV